MNNMLSQKWYLCLNVQNRIKLCRAKNHKFGDDTTVQSCTQIIRPLARFYSYDYDLRKANYIFKRLYFKEIER